MKGLLKMKFPEINPSLVNQELVEFIRSEVEKSPYDKGIIGLSGGIDSAVVAYLACEALGKENLTALIMPYKTSTKDVIEDARFVASNLGIKYTEIDISPMIDSFLKHHLHEDPRRVGSKMVRERSSLLYYYADLYKAVVLGTSNKSETLLGYFTKFGDPASDILPLKNIYKTHVIELAKAIGIPKSIIEKPPSGGMWPGQTDEEEYGFTYEEADPILYCIYDLRYSEKDLIKIGFNGELIKKVMERVHDSEFKRKHPIIPKLSKEALSIIQDSNLPLKVAIVYNKRHFKETEKKIYRTRPQMKGKTLQTIERAIQGKGYNTVLLEGDDTLIDNVRKEKVDLVFNISVGIRGESKQSFVPILLDFLQIPYTGSIGLANMIAIDKSITKQIIMNMGIPTPHYQVIKNTTRKLSTILKFPLIVKPLREGSSRGIYKDSVVDTERKLWSAVRRIFNRFNQPALVEEFIKGRELTIGIVSNKGPVFLAILETKTVSSELSDGKKLFTFDLKTDEGYRTDKTVVANLSKEQTINIQNLSLKAYRALRCRDYARIDFIIDDNNVPWLIEVNSMPGMFMNYSGFVENAKQAGILYPDLIKKILDSAIERYPTLQRRINNNQNVPRFGGNGKR